MPTSTSQRTTDLRDRQPGALSRGRCLGQDRERIAVREIIEGHQRGRVVLTQRVAQPVGVPVAGPDQVLMPPRHNLHPLPLRTVPGDRPVVVPVGAHQIGQDLGIPGIDFAPPTLCRPR